ncbi:MAG: type I-C CRISPR-associated endonuclease Cas1c [Desulfosporosinus sp.]
MRKLLNTLYVTMPDAYLARDGENVLIKTDNEIKFRVPVHNLEGIVCFGFAGASPGLMHLCCERGVALSFLTEYGKFMGRVTGKVSGNILLRKKQYQWTENDAITVRLAKRFILAKIINSRAVLHRAVRDHRQIVDTILLKDIMNDMAIMARQLDKANNLNVVRGLEGQAASLYFTGFDQLILNQKQTFRMAERNRRPPLDPINALLSFLYTLLTYEVVAALESIGLDPQAGFLHRDRPGRQSLALDVMEELRPHFADRLAVTLINRNQIDPNGFIIKENGAVVMEDKTRKDVLIAWQKRKQEEIRHPFLEEKVSLGLVPYIQSMLLARHIRGDLEDYPPFFWK